MKYLKKYENIKEPEIGDYVLCQDLTNKFTSGSRKITQEKFKLFLTENIGQVVGKGSDTIRVKFENIPNDVDILEYAFLVQTDIRIKNVDFDRINDKYSNIATFEFGEIVYFSPNKEDVEMKISTSKYNI